MYGTEAVGKMTRDQHVSEEDERRGRKREKKKKKNEFFFFFQEKDGIRDISV